VACLPAVQCAAPVGSARRNASEDQARVSRCSAPSPRQCPCRPPISGRCDTQCAVVQALGLSMSGMTGRARGRPLRESLRALRGNSRARHGGGSRHVGMIHAGRSRIGRRIRKPSRSGNLDSNPTDATISPTNPVPWPASERGKPAPRRRSTGAQRRDDLLCTRNQAVGFRIAQPVAAQRLHLVDECVQLLNR